MHKDTLEDLIRQSIIQAPIPSTSLSHDMVRVYNNSLQCLRYLHRKGERASAGRLMSSTGRAKAQNNEQLAALSDLKVLALGSHIYVFGKTLEGTEDIQECHATTEITGHEVTANLGFRS